MQLPSSTRNLKESDYRALAQQLAQKYSLPFFPAQIQQESGYNPEARSPAGAQGIAQIMPATAQSWGVDPNNPVAALTSAAQHMRDYMDRYGNDPRQALAAYNEGEGNLAKYGVTGLPETANYVQTILGAHQAPAAAPQAPVASPTPDFSSLTPLSLPASLRTPSFMDDPLSSSLQAAASPDNMILQSFIRGQGIPSPLALASQSSGLFNPPQSQPLQMPTLPPLAMPPSLFQPSNATMPTPSGQLPSTTPTYSGQTPEPYTDKTPKLSKLVSVQKDATVKGVDPRLLQAVNAFAAGIGQPVTITSGFRDRKEQADLYRKYLAGGNIAAKPGTSNHEFGKALDIAVNGRSVGLTPYADQLSRYGLHMSVPGDYPHVALMNVKG